MSQNRLAREKSPYLLQHANNPVDWYPWGDQAFEKARIEDKPVFLSIGYSTCHWCHVMERESFESAEIAAILNRDFVPIKVDREERPDVDRIYMMYVQATTGSGGWPMSVWLTPGRKPFFGGTYFPPGSRYGRPGFADVLQQIAQAWNLRRSELVSSADSILAQLREHSAVTRSNHGPEEQSLDACFLYFRRTFDSRNGGFGDAPKFPRPAVFYFLLRYYHRTGNPEALEMTLKTLREMAKGGMYDQLGGGFHRYSVDDHWFVPHFEKMLYDQAQLAVSYVEAHQITGEAQYAVVARGILDYVLRDMTHPEGGFYSAEDADSITDPNHPHEKGEGAFYIWSAQELSALLGEERAEWVMYHYGGDDDGNVHNDPHGEFTGRNIFYAAQTVAETAARFRQQPEEIAQAFEEVRQILMEARSKRPRPHLDDKILTAWNGLMISAFARAGFVLAEPRYSEAAVRAAQFIHDRLSTDGGRTLFRRWREGETAIPAFLDDYAAFVHGLIDLYEATFHVKYLIWANSYTDIMIECFEDKEHGGFYSANPEAGDLLLRLKEDYDGAEPSGNSLAALNLLRLAEFTGRRDLRDRAERLFAAFATRINQQSVTIPQMMAGFLRYLEPAAQVVLAGNPDDFVPVLRKHFRPDTIVVALNSGAARGQLEEWNPVTASMKELDGRPAAYICEKFACQLPVTEPEKLSELLQ